MFYSKKKKDIKRGWSFSFVRSVFNLGFTLLRRPVFIVESTVAAEGVSISWGTYLTTPASRLLPESKPV